MKNWGGKLSSDRVAFLDSIYISVVSIKLYVIMSPGVLKSISDTVLQNAGITVLET
jgi:hypothetical protein